MLYLETQPCDYATFAATVLRLDLPLDRSSASASLAGVETTLRSEYLADIETAIQHPVPFLANGVGVSILAFADDGKVILTRRRDHSGARPDQLDVSVVEGIDCDLDSPRAGQIDVFATVQRGCWEELGVRVDLSDVSLLALAVDTTFYQWNLVGFVDLRCSAVDLLHSHAAHAKDRWEAKLVEVDSDPEAVLRRLSAEGVWDMGLVTVYLSLCHKFGVARTRRAAANVLT